MVGPGTLQPMAAVLFLWSLQVGKAGWLHDVYLVHGWMFGGDDVAFSLLAMRHTRRRRD